MNVFQSCSDLSDAIPFSTLQGLYLKPVARLNISVQLPNLKTPGKSISNWEVMEKLRNYAVPEEFTSLKVSKSTLEVVRFEGEIENHSKLPAVLARLDGRSIKLSGFNDILKVRAAEAKPEFPSRHTWDSYFRDAKNMNEMKPGERPDTIHITNLPCKWFAAKTDTSKPSEYILRKVFEVFGDVRCVDIPMADPFRSQMKSHISGMKMFSNNQNMIFEAYVQMKEYICFVKAMDALRGMKLLHKDADGKAFSASIKVDFDKTKHLSESSIRRRRVERERLMAKERERENKERQAREEEERKLAIERKRVEEEKVAKLERQRQREERRKAKQLERLKKQEADEMNKKIATEERLLLIAQRRLESFRLMGELFNRLKVAKEKERDKYKDEKSYRSTRDRLKNKPIGKLEEKLEVKEKELREKLLKKFKNNEQNVHTRGRHDWSDQRPDCEQQFSDPEYHAFDEISGENRGLQRGSIRGGRLGWFPRRGRRGVPYGNQQFPYLPFHKGFYPQRGFPRWPRFAPRGKRGMDHNFIPPPFTDPYYLDSAINDQYYKYFQKITLGSRRSRSSTRSYSRSRSFTKSNSQSRSRSRSRSRHHRSRSHNRSRRRSTSRSRSRSRPTSRCRSRSRRKHRSLSSRCSNKSVRREKETEERKNKETVDMEIKNVEKVPSVHTWSRSPSRSRSLSWEKQNDDRSSPIKPYNKHKKEKKRKKEKKERKKKKKKHVE